MFDKDMWSRLDFIILEEFKNKTEDIGYNEINKISREFKRDRESNRNLWRNINSINGKM